jgi:hypothetical protein
MNERRRRILSCIAHVVQFDVEEKKAHKSSNTTGVANWEWKGVANWEWKGVANWEWTINFKPTGLNSLRSRRQLASNPILLDHEYSTAVSRYSLSLQRHRFDTFDRIGNV